MPARYLNFIALDAGRVDPTNGNPIIEYLQTGQGLTTEEKTTAVRWLLQEVSNKPKISPFSPAMGKIFPEQAEKDMADIIARMQKEDLRNVNLPDKTVQPPEEYPAEPSRALKIYNYLQEKMKHDHATNVKVFEVLRKLKKINPGDTYLEAYEGHFQRNGDIFLDYYHILWELAKEFEFKHVMEIGCRTGISICQLLSALKDNNKPIPETIDLFDLFNDGFITPELVKLNIKSLGIDIKPNFHIGDSKHLVPNFFNTRPLPYCLDYILIDGSHDRTDAPQDLLNAELLLAQGGVMIMDDLSTNPGECGLIDVWNEFKKGRKDEYYWLESMNAKGFGICVKR